MDKKCDYCDAQYDDSLDNCPHCGAANPYVRRGEGVPRTIEELRAWYNTHNLPDERITRFFIGKNIKEPRAFGIYQDPQTGDFIVYKNKDTGERAIRYRGGDEAYAVNELYMKLKEEVGRQKATNIANRTVPSGGSRPRKRKTSNIIGYTVTLMTMLFFLTNAMKYALFIGIVVSILLWIFKFSKESPAQRRNILRVNIIVLIALMIMSLVSGLLAPNRPNGYYNVGGNTYYSYRDNWYAYNDYTNDWYFYESGSGDTGLNGYGDAITSTNWDYHDGVSFTGSDYYGTNFSSDDSYSSSDWDSSSDWSSDYSWDSGSSDWGSDW